MPWHETRHYLVWEHTRCMPDDLLELVGVRRKEMYKAILIAASLEMKVQGKSLSNVLRSTGTSTRSVMKWPCRKTATCITDFSRPKWFSKECVYQNLRQLYACNSSQHHSLGEIGQVVGYSIFCSVRFSAALSLFILEGEGKIPLRRELGLWPVADLRFPKWLPTWKDLLFG